MISEERLDELWEQWQLTNYTTIKDFARAVEAEARKEVEAERDKWYALAGKLEVEARQLDHERDALRALLREAREGLYSLDARDDYADEIARIDAALKEKP